VILCDSWGKKAKDCYYSITLYSRGSVNAKYVIHRFCNPQTDSCKYMLQVDKHVTGIFFLVQYLMQTCYLNEVSADSFGLE